MTVDEATGLVSYPQAATGTHAVSLRVDDGRGGMAQQSFVLSVGIGTPNASPQFHSSPPVRGLAGELYLYPAAASDPDGGPPQFVLTQAPAGMTVDANTGLVQWQPSAAQTGLQAVTLQVSDQHGGAAVQRWLIDVTSTALNRPPVFVGWVSNPSLTQDEPSTLPILAQDPEAAPLRYELVSAPAGMTISPGELLSLSPWERARERASSSPGPPPPPTSAGTASSFAPTTRWTPSPSRSCTSKSAARTRRPALPASR